MTKRQLEDYLQDILDAVAAIEQFTWEHVIFDVPSSPSPFSHGEKGSKILKSLSPWERDLG